jgi:L-lactate dehydrogenase complex protein LldG
MSAAADSRSVVLERIRAATRNWDRAADRSAPVHAEPSPNYIRRGAMTAEARLERMAERLREYDAEVVECAPETLVAAIETQLTASGRRSFVVPEGLPKDWLAQRFDWKIDDGLTSDAIEQTEGVVTACFCAVAESGTIVLHHGPMEGRRIITLLPDWHLCVLRESQIVETLPEYFDRCAQPPQFITPGLVTSQLVTPRLVTWISGPSATADIEMTRIKGVHGPRFLHVVIVRD